MWGLRDQIKELQIEKAELKRALKAILQAPERAAQIAKESLDELGKREQRNNY